MALGVAEIKMSIQDQILLEALERAMNEIEALEAIYGDEYNGSDASHFAVVSKSELNSARSVLEGDVCAYDDKAIPQLEINIVTCFENDDGERINLGLRCRLPPGYPETTPVSVSASIDGVRRSLREELSAHLNEKAESMIGVEAIMELVDELREVAPSIIAKERSIETNGKKCNASHKVSESEMFGRRWIWVHHITDSARRKDIIREAKDLNLGGFLKFGYPGIIVIEGDSFACDEFVTWIKGNKSRPGGFGRNWGHHVKGQINFPRGTRCLPIEFEELEDLALLSRVCKERGLENEFLEYVMQHKRVNS